MMKFKVQLIGIGLVGLLGSIVIGICSWYAQEMNNEVLSTSQMFGQAQHNHMESDMMHDALRGDVLAALYFASEQKMQTSNVASDLAEHIERFQTQLAANKKLPLSAEVKAALNELDVPLQAYIRAATKQVELSATDYAAAKLLFPEFQNAFGDLEIKMEQVTDLLQEAEATAVAESQSKIAFADDLIIVMVLVFGAAACGFAMWISGRVMRQLGGEPIAVVAVSRRIASGDYVTKSDNGQNTDSLLGQLEVTRQILLDNQTRDRESEALKQQQSEQQQKNLQEAQRIRRALDGTSTNVMIADVDRNIVYANQSVLAMLSKVETELRKVLPQFSVDKIVGSNMDIFHKVPAHQAALLARLESTFTSNITVAGQHFRLIASPIIDTNGARLGNVVEWQDRTAEVHAENEIAAVVEAAGQGDFSKKVNENGKVGFMLGIAKGLNQLTGVSQTALQEIAGVLQQIAAGDMRARVNSQYQGTFDTLKQGCNDTAEKLSAMLLGIRDSALTINTASSEISKGNTDLSSRTEQQASSLEETASSMEELTGTVRQNADNARQANQLAARASEIAVNGGDLIHQVVTTMASIHESSRKIADIISVIDGIAFQTNILALNAAVEAARAGEQGRGFAVVAGEVRTLAQRSANAAKDIKDLISDSVSKISNGNTLVGRSGDTMQEIVTAIKRVNDIMSEIAAASAEQAAGLDEVGKAVSQMDEMTQQNAALVEEAAAASESLLVQSESLADAVSMFKIDDHNRVAPTRTVATRALPNRVSSAAKPKAPMAKPKKPEDDEWESF
jgi:methyl-accepting chemotaxis protein